MAGDFVEIENLFTKVSYHRNISKINIVKNIYYTENSNANYQTKLSIYVAFYKPA